MSEVARHIVFRGRVQGVGFRFTACRAAERHGLTGTVRNVPGGTVEMIAQGPAGQIEACIREIQEAFSGYITETEIEQTRPSELYGDFRVSF
jgi:acylphosphatase